jgi:F420-non-reducing hydrogenase iron-sulfur subunit
MNHPAFIFRPSMSERHAMAAQNQQGKILILATESCAYPGANAVGQAHMSYPANTYILRVRAPVLFPERFYLDCFDKGIWGIIIMSCGVECPYEGAYEALAKRVDTIYVRMKERGLDIRRLRLTSICTVCTRAFVKEVQQMNELIADLGPPGTEQLSAQVAQAG